MNEQQKLLDDARATVSNTKPKTQPFKYIYDYLKWLNYNDIVDDCFIQRTGEETFQKICQDLNIQWTNKAIKTHTIFYNFDQEDYEKLYFYIKIIGEQII